MLSALASGALSLIPGLVSTIGSKFFGGNSQQTIGQSTAQNTDDQQKPFQNLLSQITSKLSELDSKAQSKASELDGRLNAIIGEDNQLVKRKACQQKVQLLEDKIQKLQKKRQYEKQNEE